MQELAKSDHSGQPWGQRPTKAQDVPRKLTGVDEVQVEVTEHQDQLTALKEQSEGWPE